MFPFIIDIMPSGFCIGFGAPPVSGCSVSYHVDPPKRESERKHNTTRTLQLLPQHLALGAHQIRLAHVEGRRRQQSVVGPHALRPRQQLHVRQGVRLRRLVVLEEHLRVRPPHLYQEHDDEDREQDPVPDLRVQHEVISHAHHPAKLRSATCSPSPSRNRNLSCLRCSPHAVPVVLASHGACLLSRCSPPTTACTIYGQRCRTVA